MTTMTEPEKQTAEITYRWLKKEEWGRIAGIFHEHGVEPPSEDISIVAVAEENGQIVGLLPLQLVAHAEPLWIAPGHEGKVSWKRLLAMIDAGVNKTVTQYYVFAPDSRIARMCELVGLDRLPWTIFQRRL